MGWLACYVQSLLMKGSQLRVQNIILRYTRTKLRNSEDLSEMLFPSFPKENAMDRSNSNKTV